MVVQSGAFVVPSNYASDPLIVRMGIGRIASFVECGFRKAGSVVSRTLGCGISFAADLERDWELKGAMRRNWKFGD